MPLISSKVKMNQFQRTFFLIIRKISIFESALIHRRTHRRTANNGSYFIRVSEVLQVQFLLARFVPVDKDILRKPLRNIAALVGQDKPESS